MNNIIKEYYEKAHTMPFLIEQKMMRFANHPDIRDEFEYWILKKKYKTIEAVDVLGYTAKKLSEISPYLNGEGAFILLMELRDNPDKAKKRIAHGFKKK